MGDEDSTRHGIAKYTIPLGGNWDDDDDGDDDYFTPPDYPDFEPKPPFMARAVPPSIVAKNCLQFWTKPAIAEAGTLPPVGLRNPTPNHRIHVVRPCHVVPEFAEHIRSVQQKARLAPSSKKPLPKRQPALYKAKCEPVPMQLRKRSFT